MRDPIGRSAKLGGSINVPVGVVNQELIAFKRGFPHARRLRPGLFSASLKPLLMCWFELLASARGKPS